MDAIDRLSARPPLYATTEHNFWTDPYVSGHVLDAHLDPHIDDASRKPAQISGTVESIIAEATTLGILDRESPRLLDLGCGPGLYAEQFAMRGFAVTGIDQADRSIDYARDQARRQGVAIDYRVDDMLSAPFDGPYDVITLIYGEFGTVSESERTELLRRVRSALAPGGLFVFDVFTDRYVKRMRGGPDWYVSNGKGFWSGTPHLVLERVHHYRDASASVNRYIVIDRDGSYREFNVWWRHYTAPEIDAVITTSGFRLHARYANLWGDPPQPNDEWIGVFATRE